MIAELPSGDDGRPKAYRIDIAEVHERDYMRPGLEHKFPNAVVEQVECDVVNRKCRAILFENMTRDRVEFNYWIPELHDESLRPTNEDRQILWKRSEQAHEGEQGDHEESYLNLPNSFGLEQADWTPEE